MEGKQFQLFQEAVPTLSRLTVLRDTTIPLPSFAPESYEAAARALGLQIQFMDAGGHEDLGSIFETAVREHTDGLFVSMRPVIVANEARIAELAVQSGLPSIWCAPGAPRRVSRIEQWPPGDARAGRTRARWAARQAQRGRPGSRVGPAALLP